MEIWAINTATALKVLVSAVVNEAGPWTACFTERRRVMEWLLFVIMCKKQL